MNSRDCKYNYKQTLSFSHVICHSEIYQLSPTSVKLKPLANPLFTKTIYKPPSYLLSKIQFYDKLLPPFPGKNKKQRAKKHERNECNIGQLP